MTTEDILGALSMVEDPDLKKDLVTLGMIKNLVLSEDKVSFELELTTPACPMKDMLVRACKNAISIKVSPDLDVNIDVTSRTTSNVLREGALEGVKNIIAVASGKGGVGKSTVAANVALTLAKMGAKVGLMDADIYGPSVPSLFGLERMEIKMEEIDGKQMMHPPMQDGVKVFSIGFMVSPEEPLVWRGPMLTSILRQFANDVIWGDLDYLVVDLPPGTGDVQISMAQMLNLSGSIIVSTPQELSVADVRKAISMWNIPALNVPVLGIVENMSYFQTEDGKEYNIFGEGGGEKLSSESGFPLLAKIPIFEPKTGGNNSLVKYNKSLEDLYVKLVGSVVSNIAIINSND